MEASQQIVRYFRQCKKSVQIRSFFWFAFPCIWTEYRKIRTRKNSVFRHFSCSEDTRLIYLKNPLTGFLSAKSLRNKITDVREILHNLCPGYLALDETLFSITKLELPVIEISMRKV